MVARQELPPPSGPRISEWPAIRDDMAVLIDRVVDLRQTLIAVNGKRPPKIKPYPRPVTASERIKQQDNLARHRERAARFAALPRIPMTPKGA